MKHNMKNHKKHLRIEPDIIWFIASIITIFGIGITGAIYGKNIDNKLWNDGYCQECGNEWEYQDMYHVKNGSNRYIYCDSEGHIIEISKNHGK